MNNHELMMTELVFQNLLTDLHHTEIAALLSCFVFQQKKCSEPKLTKTLQEVRLIRQNIVGHFVITNSRFDGDRQTVKYTYRLDSYALRKSLKNETRMKKCTEELTTKGTWDVSVREKLPVQSKNNRILS